VSRHSSPLDLTQHEGFTSLSALPQLPVSITLPFSITTALHSGPHLWSLSVETSSPLDLTQHEGFTSLSAAASVTGGLHHTFSITTALHSGPHLWNLSVETSSPLDLTQHEGCTSLSALLRLSSLKKRSIVFFLCFFNVTPSHPQHLDERWAWVTNHDA
jgi:hypothetical protein